MTRQSSNRCEQCGRMGTRNFKVIGGFWDKIDPDDNEPMWFPFITICANTNACHKRQPNLDSDLEMLERA